MSATVENTQSGPNRLTVHMSPEPIHVDHANQKNTNAAEQTSNKVPPPPQKRNGDFKSLKYSNEIQTIFPMKPLASTWEDDLQNKYKMVEEKNWDKGFKVWRSLPMQSELEQKINVHNVPLKKSSDFTRTAKPEAYLPGFSSRKAGPISRPREFRMLPIKKAPAAVKKEVKVKQESTNGSEDGLTRRESGPMLHEGILKGT